MTTLVSGGAMPVGAILAFGGPISNVPDGFLLCDGSILNRNDFVDLFAAIGTAWGTSSGVDFRIPTTQGLFLRGQANGSGYDPNRNTRAAINAGGNTGDNVGTYQSHQFSSHNHGGGSHSHGLEGRNDRGNTNFLGSASFGGNLEDNSRKYMHSSNGSYRNGLVSSVSTISTQGGSQNNPYNVNVNYIIKY